MERKIKDPTLNGEWACSLMGLLMEWRQNGAMSRSKNPSELRDRVDTAVNTLGTFLLGQVEEQYAPVERKFSVTVEVTETRRENTVVTATDENEASMKALAEDFEGEKASVVSVVDLEA